MFSDSDSENESIHRLTINEHYAKAFEYKKEREELEKLKLKYGSDYEEPDVDSETDSESAESEDEDGEELTAAVDAAILRTLAKIKRKDPDIYDKQKGIFEEEQSNVSSAKPTARAPKDKSKPVTLRQVVLESTLNTTQSRSPSPRPLTHEEEQRALRDETIAAFHHSVDNQNDDADDLLVLREKTKDELEQEEEEYRTFLEREVGTNLADLVTVDSSTWQEVQTGKEKKSEGTKRDTRKLVKLKEEENQEFLMNYILNRGWIDRSAKRVPTYQEVTSKSIKKSSQGDAEDSGSEDPENQLPTVDPDIDEDDFEEIVDRFESSYNFRFEEPDAATIKTYPRNLPSTVRREDSTRKDARARRKERKEAELLKKREEIKRMKALKMKEIRAKLDRIGQEGGKSYQDDPALQELDLDGDWDPEAHDKQMSKLYGEDQEFDENEKPVWDDDIDIADIVPDAEERRVSKKKQKKEKEKEKSEDGVDIDDMDADVDKFVNDEEWDGTEEMRKRKLDEYMDEIYGLDFNDIAGGIPTRFKYASITPQDYALSPTEILMATDAELNEYMGIKKFAPYRNKEERYDSKRRERLRGLKQKLKERSGTAVVASAEDSPAKKRKGKKERMRLKQEMATSTEATSTERMKHKAEEEVDEKPRTKKRRRYTEES